MQSEKEQQQQKYSISEQQMSNGLILRKIGHKRNGKGIEEIFKVITVENYASVIKQ